MREHTGNGKEHNRIEPFAEAGDNKGIISKLREKASVVHDHYPLI